MARPKKSDAQEAVPEHLKEDFAGRKTPREVLYDEMIFYHQKAVPMGNEIARIIKEGGKARGDLLFELFKIMCENKKMAVEVASKLAPYEHAKLQSLEVKSTSEHRFVIRAPERLESSEVWLKSAGKENTEPLTIDHKPKKVGHFNKRVELADIDPSLAKLHKQPDIDDIIVDEYAKPEYFDEDV